MAVTIKSPSAIEKMRRSNHLLSIVFAEMRDVIRPGISTKDINDLCERTIRSLGGVPNFLHYMGYPASVCTSVNDEVVHGIPSRDRILQEGDIISLDAGLIYDGYHSDAARTYGVGHISKEAQALIDATRGSFFAGMQFAHAGCHLNDISSAIGNYADVRGYGVVRDLCGHGIGTEMHEDPEIMNFAQKECGILLKKGMTLAVEPMLTCGTWEVHWGEDGWTVTTADGSLAAHYENTILITDGKPEILSLGDDEPRA